MGQSDFINFGFENSGLLWVPMDAEPGLRPYCPYRPELSRSHLISDAKQGQAWLALGGEDAEPEPAQVSRFFGCCAGPHPRPHKAIGVCSQQPSAVIAK